MYLLVKKNIVVDMSEEKYDSEYIKKIVGWLDEQETKMKKGMNLCSS